MGLIVAYGYLMEFFFAWYSGNLYEISTALFRLFGFYSPLFWLQILFNVIIPQAFWFKRVRTNIPMLFTISILINVGMWIERFIIVVTSLARDYLPSSWGLFIPTIWDIATFVGTIGLFFALIFLFIRFLPSISIFEMRELVSEQESSGD
jgi:molybdopterin-containing oxidoreductase family membrane subunit